MVELSGTDIVYLACGATDMRKAIDGLAGMVEQHFKLDPFSKAMFAFCNKDSNKIKILQWDNNGFWLLSSLNNYSSRKQKFLNYPTFCTFLFE